MIGKWVYWKKGKLKKTFSNKNEKLREPENHPKRRQQIIDFLQVSQESPDSEYSPSYRLFCPESPWFSDGGGAGIFRIFRPKFSEFSTKFTHNALLGQPKTLQKVILVFWITLLGIVLVHYRWTLFHGVRESQFFVLLEKKLWKNVFRNFHDILQSEILGILFLLFRIIY